MEILRADIQTAFFLSKVSLTPLPGGDIAKAYRVDASEGCFFAKVMAGKRGEEVLCAEAYSLGVLQADASLSCPGIHGLETLRSGSCLLMEFISPGDKTQKAMERLGRGLAAMHAKPLSSFGWKSDNFIGPLPQANPPMEDWVEFYATQRLLPLYKGAAEKGLLRTAEIPAEEKMEQRLRDALPTVIPSLLHGDLWGGNYLISERGVPYLIDPASYRGHSEVDLAMSRLFGGFPEAFYGAYRECVPDVPGWEHRIGLYQLYYLLVHLLLFGNSYAGAVRQRSGEWFGP